MVNTIFQYFTKIIYFLSCLVIYVFLFFGCWGDRHPNYPDTFVDNVNISCVETYNSGKECSRYIPVIVKEKVLYLQDSCLYDIRGNLIHTSCIGRISSNRELRYTGERTFAGYYIFKIPNENNNTFYLFDFDNDRFAGDIMTVGFNSYMKEEFSEELMQRLDSLQMQLPEIPVMRGHWMYASPDTEDKEKFTKLVTDNYNTAIMDFVTKNKNEVYLYSSENCLIFPNKGVAFILKSNIEGLPSFAEHTKPMYKTKKPPVSIRQTGSAFLGYRKEYTFGIPLPVSNGYVYYSKLVCDGKTFNFKNNGQSIFLYDYEQTDDKTYFALSYSSNFTNVYLYEYHRKAK